MINPDFLEREGERAHIHGINNEVQADRYGLRTALSQGWLDEETIDQICSSFRGQRADRDYPGEEERCDLIRSYAGQISSQRRR